MYAFTKKTQKRMAAVEALGKMRLPVSDWKTMEEQTLRGVFCSYDRHFDRIPGILRIEPDR